MTRKLFFVALSQEPLCDAALYVPRGDVWISDATPLSSFFVPGWSFGTYCSRCNVQILSRYCQVSQNLTSGDLTQIYGDWGVQVVHRGISRVHGVVAESSKTRI